MMIQIPINKTTQPKSGLSFLLSIFLARFTPAIIPITESPVKINKNCQLTSILSIEEPNPIKELKDIMNKDVATASFIEIPKSIINAGTIKNPPPAPTKPVTIPTKIPCEISKV